MNSEVLSAWACMMPGEGTSTHAHPNSPGNAPPLEALAERRSMRRWLRSVSRLFGTIRYLGVPRRRAWYLVTSGRAWRFGTSESPGTPKRCLLKRSFACRRAAVALREDFALYMPDGRSVRAAGLRECGPERLRVSFRLLPLREAMAVTVTWRSRKLSRLKLPYLGETEFLQGLRLDAPALLARIGGRSTPCAAIVAGQCDGLSCCGLLTNSTSLLPLAGMEFTIEFVHDASGRSYRVTPPLGRAELTSRRAFVMLQPKDFPDCPGPWSVRCSVAGRPLATLELRVVTPDAFERSIYLVDACYQCEKGNGAATIRPYPTILGDIRRLGPRFRVASREAGVAGLCTLDMRDPSPRPGRIVGSPGTRSADHGRGGVVRADHLDR